MLISIDQRLPIGTKFRVKAANMKDAAAFKKYQYAFNCSEKLVTTKDALVHEISNIDSI